MSGARLSNAGLGMGVSYNAITGNTESTVEGSTLEAQGQETETVGDKQKGVAVKASGQHNLRAWPLTAGLPTMWPWRSRHGDRQQHWRHHPGGGD